MLRSLFPLAAIALGVAVTACGSHQASGPNTSGSSSAKPVASSSTTVAPATTVVPAGTTSAAPDCVGLSICTPPPPDAEGNPACYYSDGWQANSAGAGIEIWYFHEPQNLSKPDKVTAIVRKKDGTNESQDAAIEAGQQTHRFEFSTIDKSAVQEVLLATSSGRCFVIGG
ncbi:hypothetical protein H7I75_17355 [Mycobacterium stomatepiae]|nr:hypothetical protein [Mycobacterium stomatepiae]